MISLLSLAFSLALAQIADSQSAGQARGGTCEIRGRITDTETGLPIVRAVVRLNRIGGTNMLMARTDDDGRYQFKALPAGEYDGFVDPGEFRATHLPTSLSSESATSARRRIVLKEGDVRADVNVALARALAITVRVVDEWGEPLSGLRVRVQFEGGRRISYPSTDRTTDDRGRLRLFKLPPGRYVVCAEVDAIGSGSQSTSPRREQFLRTCYPSATAETQAELVTLEHSDIDVEIRMRRGRSFTISGTVLDASGGVASSANLNLNRFERGGSSGTGIPVRSDGRFTVTNVASGDYAIEAELGGPDRPEQRRELEVGYEPVRIDSSDIDGMVVSMVKSVEVAGRVTLEDAALPFPRPLGSGLMVTARVAGDSSPGMGSSGIAHAGEDRVFILSRMFGRRILDVLNVPSGWYVKSIRYGGKEIIGVPTVFKAGRDPSELQVLLSTRGAMISGRVVNERGEAVPGARVIRLPADPAQWGLGQVTSVGVSATGRFQLGPQRGGDYLILAVIPSPRVPEPDDRDRVARLAEVAERIRLGDEEQRTIELRVIEFR
jgi:protocatechuate 3,4-dioxygenase beta subunit